MKTLRPPSGPLPATLDKFLFATVGEVTEGAPLSVVSALVRLGLDPWEEAGRLSSLSRREAVEQLARLVAELPGRCCSLAEAREIAGPLVVLLPNHDSSPRILPLTQIRPRYLRLATSLAPPYWVICSVLAAAAVLSAIAHHGFPFGIGGP